MPRTPDELLALVYDRSARIRARRRHRVVAAASALAVLATAVITLPGYLATSRRVPSALGRRDAHHAPAQAGAPEGGTAALPTADPGRSPCTCTTTIRSA